MKRRTPAQRKASQDAWAESMIDCLTKTPAKRLSSNWLPMNTAPTHGGRILIKEGSWVLIGMYDGHPAWRDTGAGMREITNPLGWMPLPEL